VRNLIALLLSFPIIAGSAQRAGAAGSADAAIVQFEPTNVDLPAIQRISDRLDLALQTATGLSVLSRAETIKRLDSFRDSEHPCESTRCRTALASFLGVKLIAELRLRREPMPSGSKDRWTALLTLHNAVTRATATQSRVCEPCSEREFLAAVDDLVGETAKQLPGKAGDIFVQSRPVDGELLIDKELVGKTPFRHSVSIGEHVLVVRAAGYRKSAPVTIQVRAGEEQSVTITLEPAPVIATPVKRPIASRAPVFFGLGAVTAVLAAGSGVGLAVEASRNGAPACGELPVGVPCSTKIDATAGIGLAVAGVAVFAGTSIALFTVGAREAKRARRVSLIPAASPWFSGATVSLSLD
jgi:hypothetical protein